MKRKIRLITLADREYFDYTKALINSAKINFPQAKPHVYLVNLTDEEGKQLQSINPQVEYTIENVGFRNVMQKKCYCTNRRSYILHFLRRSTNDILVWLDADSLIRKSCDELIDICYNCDVALKRKNDYDTGGKGIPTGFMAGLIIVGVSPMSLQFVQLYDRFLDKLLWYKIPKNFQMSDILKTPDHIMKIWMANQNVLEKIYSVTHKRGRFVLLPQKFLDCDFLDESVIWSLKASTRGNEKFMCEMRQYA
jgi:hypothetical protein